MGEPREPSAEPNDKPLLVSDVAGAEQHAPAVRHDIAELVANMQGGEPAVQQIINQMIEHQALARQVSFSILSRLQLMGVDGAGTLAKKLESMDPTEYPLAADMSAVAFAYEEERVTSSDPLERLSLKKLGSLAHVVFGIATVKATSTMSGRDSPEGAHFIKYARENIDAAEHDLAPSTQAALTTLLDEVQSTIEQPSSE